jgi:hypothetical protein
MPPAYVGAPLVQPSADAGTCILTPTATMIRPKIGGSIAKQHSSGSRKVRGKKTQRRYRKSRRQRAGFLPSIGEPFAAAAGKYVAPIALYGLYKFLDGKKEHKKGRKQTRRRR